MLDWEQSLAADGFAISPERLTGTELAKLLEDVQAIGAHRGKAGIRHVLASPAISSLACDGRLLGIARQVLGPRAFPFRATLFDKSPMRNWLIAWHQDTALPLCERHELAGWGPWSVKDGVIYAHAPASALGQIMALRIHLDESTGQNGPLRVLPRTHTMGVLNDEDIHKLSTEIRAVTCTVAPGGVLAMRPLVVHASSKSRIASPRRVLHIEYAAQPTLAGAVPLAIA